MAFYVFRWYCQIPRPFANKIAAHRLRIFKTQNMKNIVKFTFYFFNHRQQKLILRFFINPCPYFWFRFLRFDDFKQLLGIFQSSETSSLSSQPRSRAIKIAYCQWAIRENPAPAAAKQIARFVKTNACQLLISTKRLLRRSHWPQNEEIRAMV